MALYDLRLSDEVFWSITPLEFDHLVERYTLEEERTDRRFALGSWMMAVCWGSKKGSKQPKIEDFMLHDYRGKSEVKKDWKQSLQTLKEQVGKIKK